MEKHGVSRRKALQLLGGASMGLLAAAASREAVDASSDRSQMSQASGADARSVGTSTTPARVDRNVSYGPGDALKYDQAWAMTQS
jgi:hypothetical protein